MLVGAAVLGLVMSALAACSRSDGDAQQEVSVSVGQSGETWDTAIQDLSHPYDTEIDVPSEAPATSTSAEAPEGSLASLAGRTPDAGVLLRTSYADPAQWRQAWRQMTTETDEGFLANLLPIEDRALEDVTAEAALGLLPSTCEVSYVLIADRRTMSHDEHPVLVVDRREPPSRPPFRAAASAVQAVENNLSIANMDFSEFADSVDKDGIFRGFSDG